MRLTCAAVAHSTAQTNLQMNQPMKHEALPSLTTRPQLKQHFFLAWTCAMYCTLAPASARAQGSAEQGFRLMAAGSAGNCVVCHSMPGASGPASTFAPALHQAGARYSPQQLRQWVTDARLIKPATLMPPFGTTQGTNSPVLAQPLLSFDDIGHVVAALETLR